MGTFSGDCRGVELAKACPLKVSLWPLLPKAYISSPGEGKTPGPTCPLPAQGRRGSPGGPVAGKPNAIVLAQLLWTLPTVICSTQSFLLPGGFLGLRNFYFRGEWSLVILFFLFLQYPGTSLGKQRNGEVSNGRHFDQPKQLVLLNTKREIRKQ